MTKLFLKSTISLSLWASAPMLLAAPLSIGVVISDGRFTLNDSETTGNIAVMEGSSIQTGSSLTSIRLNDGGRIIFGADSRGKFSGKRLALEQGSARIAGYSVAANTLKINADQASSANVSIRGKVVEVAALTGSVHVFSAAGINVANLLSGQAVDLQPQESGATAPSSLTGCVTKVGNSFQLTDETSKVPVVLHGRTFKTGQRIRVSGMLVTSDPSPDSPKDLNIIKMNILRGACGSSNRPGTAAFSAAGAVGSGAAGVGAGAGATSAAAGAGAIGATAAGSAAVGAGISGAMIAGVAVAAAAVATTVGVVASQSSSSSLSAGR